MIIKKKHREFRDGFFRKLLERALEGKEPLSEAFRRFLIPTYQASFLEALKAMPFAKSLACYEAILSDPNSELGKLFAAAGRPARPFNSKHKLFRQLAADYRETKIEVLFYLKQDLDCDVDDLSLADLKQIFEETFHGVCLFDAVGRNSFEGAANLLERADRGEIVLPDGFHNLDEYCQVFVEAMLHDNKRMMSLLLQHDYDQGALELSFAGIRIVPLGFAITQGHQNTVDAFFSGDNMPRYLADVFSVMSGVLTGDVGLIANDIDYYKVFVEAFLAHVDHLPHEEQSRLLRAINNPQTGLGQVFAARVEENHDVRRRDQLFFHRLSESELPMDIRVEVDRRVERLNATRPSEAGQAAFFYMPARLAQRASYADMVPVSPPVPNLDPVPDLTPAQILDQAVLRWGFYSLRLGPLRPGYAAASRTSTPRTSLV
jgi:hypothetical protein